MDPSSLFAPFNADVQSIKAFGLERGVALAGATFCGALLGYERELRGSPAGMKTARPSASAFGAGSRPMTGSRLHAGDTRAIGKPWLR